MQFDRKALNRLLLLNDRQLEIVIRKLATDYGLDLSALHITTDNMRNLRETLRNATDEELKSLGDQLRRGGGTP
ncbi:MAG: hypothetical protein IJC99_06220 [Clostridia bacterium]|nr:hypothetical protein [Clostridia bacterium]